jgi:hypothetical protein
MPLTVTDVLAIYGAGLSSIAFGWNLFRDLRDKARIKVSAHIRRTVQTIDGKWYAVKPDLGVEGASEQLFLVVNVTNAGRRPVLWTGWGGKYSKPLNGRDSFSIIPVAIPKKLSEGETHSEYTADLSPAGDNVKRLFIWDATGRNWYLSRGALRKLKAEYVKYHGAV